MKKLIGLSGVLAAGAALLLASPAHAVTATSVIHPSDFVSGMSDTRTTGHYEVQGTGLHVWTEGNTSTDKVAEYVATNTPLAQATDTALNLTVNSGTIPPGAQLVVDFDGNGTPDGILVGEPTFYQTDWWLSNGSSQAVKVLAPLHTGGSGSDNHGTLAQWIAAFPDAKVVAFGFSLGSGVQGDYVIDSIRFAGTTYTFAKDVTLSGKDECKSGGGATSTLPVYKNQGECVSAFASGKQPTAPVTTVVVNTAAPVTAPAAATAAISDALGAKAAWLASNR